MATPGVTGGARCTIKLDEFNETQPEAILAVKPQGGGRMRLDEDGFIISAPELIAETAESVWNAKLEAYQRNGVQEYVVWRVLDNAIDWFILEAGQFVPLPCEAGVYRSRVFPGLWLDVQAILDGNLAKVFEVVQQGAATPEHRDFVNTLQQRAQSAG